MHTVFTTYLIKQECPAGKTEKNCALRKYIKESDLFHIGQNETLLEPTKELYRLARAEYVSAIEEMNQICRQCQMENAQRTK
jgi:hypothetical protein